MTDAEKLFSLSYMRELKAWGMLMSFRQVAKAGLPHAELVISAQHSATMQWLVEETSVFVGGDRPLSAEQMNGLRSEMTKQTLENAQVSVDAASLVFMHSMIDDATLNYCEVTALAKPDDWEPWIEDKEFRLKELRTRGYPELFREALDDRLKKLEGESVMAKADMLFRLCKPGKDFNPKEDYKYDRDRLVAFDKQRHNIIHGDGLGSKFASLENDLGYLQDTMIYFALMVSKKFGVRIDPQVLTS